MEDAGESPEQGGFPETRNAFEQNVSAREHADQDTIDHVDLAYDDFRDFLANLIEQNRGVLNVGMCGHLFILAMSLR